MRPPILVCFIGPTNAGKTSLFDTVHAMKVKCVHTIEVGKFMRAKYPASYFKGQSNPKHTAEEAWNMFTDGLAKAHEDPECLLVFADGQPRDIQQFNDITRMQLQKIIVHLWAPEEERRRRAVERDGSDPKKLALSLARMIGDVPSLYDILSRALNHGYDVRSYDTSHPRYSASEVINSLVAYAAIKGPRT